VLNDFLISIRNQLVNPKIAQLPLNSAENQGNFAQKSVVARKKLGSRDQRPLHRKGTRVSRKERKEFW